MLLGEHHAFGQRRAVQAQHQVGRELGAWRRKPAPPTWMRCVDEGADSTASSSVRWRRPRRPAAAVASPCGDLAGWSPTAALRRSRCRVRPAARPGPASGMGGAGGAVDDRANRAERGDSRPSGPSITSSTSARVERRPAPRRQPHAPTSRAARRRRPPCAGLEPPARFFAQVVAHDFEAGGHQALCQRVAHQAQADDADRCGGVQTVAAQVTAMRRRRSGSPAR